MAPIDILKELRDRVAGMEAAFASQSARLERIDERQSAIESGLEAVTQALASFERTIRTTREDDRSGDALRDEIERGLEPVGAAVAEIRRMAQEERAALDRRDPGPDIAALREAMDELSTGTRAITRELRGYKARAGYSPGTWRGRLAQWWEWSRWAEVARLVVLTFGAVGLTVLLGQIALAIAPDGSRRIMAGTALGTGDPADLYENGWALIRAGDPDQHAFDVFGSRLVRDNMDVVDACRREALEATRSDAEGRLAFMPCTIRFLASYDIRLSRTRLEGMEPAPSTVPEPRSRPVR